MYCYKGIITYLPGIIVFQLLALNLAGNNLKDIDNTPEERLPDTATMLVEKNLPTSEKEELTKTAFIEFGENRKNYCHSDPGFEVLGINLMSSKPGTFTISGGTGLTDHNNNTATVYPAQLNPGYYTLTYHPVNNIPVTAEFEVGSNLVADFDWDKVCYQSETPVKFSNKTSSPFGLLTDTSFYWKVYINKSLITFRTPECTFTFPKPGNYQVALYINNSFGCRDSSRKTFPLSRIIPLSGTSYFESFESTGNDWNPGTKADDLNSWKLGKPEIHGIPAHGFPGAYSGVNCWYTNINKITAPKEQSWIASACFDFTGTTKPMLIARIRRSFSDNKDGASLQTSTDNGKTWNILGTINSGINWYNDNYGVTAMQVPGWTDARDTEWIEVRQPLDELTGLGKVQFRFLYDASGTVTGNDGIAFDDIQILERTHTSIIEHFTNSSDPESAPADSIVNAFTSENASSVINLQYHTSAPANDPFYIDNPVIPTTRQLYYDMSTVPFSLLNGGTRSDHRFNYNPTKPEYAEIVVESLVDSKFFLSAKTLIEGSDLWVEARVKALKEMPWGEYSLRIAVIEPQINRIKGDNGVNIFRNVVKMMLPGATGTIFTQSWMPADSVTVVEMWPVKNVYDISRLQVIAFIQDESTSEIYQSALDTRGIFSENGDPQTEKTSVLVTPNPASEEIWVLFPKEPQNRVMLKLYNSLGIEVYSGYTKPGLRQFTLPLREFNNGLYVLRIQESGQSPVSIKLFIEH
jgi:hypothetical protein